MSRVKVEYRTGSKDVYNKFCTKYPDAGLSYTKWREIIDTFNDLFREYILETGEKGKMPWGIGVFAVSKKKTKKTKKHDGKEYVNLPIDWQKTKKAGRKIYNFNTHTDGFRFRWYIFPRESRFQHPDIWNFKPSRVSSRKIAEYLKIPQQQELYKQWQRRK